MKEKLNQFKLFDIEIYLHHYMFFINKQNEGINTNSCYTIMLKSYQVGRDWLECILEKKRRGRECFYLLEGSISAVMFRRIFNVSIATNLIGKKMFVRLQDLLNLILFLKEQVFLLAFDLSLCGKAVIELFKQHLRFHEIVLINIDFDIIREERHESRSSKYTCLLAVFDPMLSFFVPRRRYLRLVSMRRGLPSQRGSSCNQFILLSNRVYLLHCIRLDIHDNDSKEFSVLEIRGFHVRVIPSILRSKRSIKVLLDNTIDLQFKVIRRDV